MTLLLVVIYFYMKTKVGVMMKHRNCFSKCCKGKKLQYLISIAFTDCKILVVY